MKLSRRNPPSLRILAAVLLGLTLAGAAGDEPPREGTFEGDWALSGTARPVEVGSATVVLSRLEGPVTLRSAGGLARKFDAVCNSVSDQKTGGVGRCTWTDEAGDTLLLELSGTILGPAGTVREARGSVIGGTGRYAAVEGEFRVDWLFVDSVLDDERFKGYVSKLEGHWKRP